MAFTAGGATQGAILIKEQYQAAVTDAVYINNQFTPLFRRQTQQGGRYVNWIVHKSGNTSVEVFTEGQGTPNSGGQGYSLAQVAPTYIRAMVEITGHAKDAMQSNYANGIDMEISSAASDMADLFTTSFLGGTYGLELAIDSGSTYAGIARGSAAYWESTETAHGGVLSFTGLQDLNETIHDNDKGGNPKMVLCPWNQVTNIYNLGGMPFIKVGDVKDQAASSLSPTWNGMPVQGIGDMTDTVIVLFDPADCALIETRPFTVDFQGRSGDANVYQLSMAIAFVVWNPKLHGKLTGVTA